MPLQVWIRIESQRKRLIVHSMPVQHVHLCVGHAVEEPLQHANRLKVPLGEGLRPSKRKYVNDINIEQQWGFKRVDCRLYVP